MKQVLDFHDFTLDRNEHQLEPDDRVTATYMVTNRCDCVTVTSIEITHMERTDVNGMVTLSCEPSVVTVPDSLDPHESRQVSLELVTRGELPGRHALRIRATYSCRPVAPTVDGLLEFTVTAD